METEREFSRRRQRLARLVSQIASLLGESEAALDSGEALSNAGVGRQEGLRVKLDDTFRAYLEEHSAVVDGMRAQLRSIEEAKRKAAMAEKQSPQATPGTKPATKPEKNQARIEKVSEELSTTLRLDRVDRAIKDLLEFLADSEFFAANASRGRRQRLRTLQNAIEKALQK